MITAARLRERNNAKGWLLRSHTSTLGHRYTAGVGGAPSMIRIVDSSDEAEELAHIEQFEVLVFKGIEELEEFVNKEMQTRVRSGSLPVQAKIENAPKLEAPKPPPVAEITEPTPVGEPVVEEEPAPV